MTRDDFMPVHWTGAIYDPITRYHWTSNAICGYSRDPPTLLLQDFPNHSKSQSRRRLIDLNATLVELHDDDHHHHESFLSPHELLNTRHPSRLERQIEALEQVWSEQESQGTLASIGVFAFLCPRVPDEADDLTHERPSSSIAEQCLRLRIRACAQSKRRSGPTSRDYLHHVLLLAETYVRMSCWSQSQVHATRVQRELGAMGHHHHDHHQHLASRVHLVFGQVALANQDWRAARGYLQRVAKNNESLDAARKRACAHALGQALVGLAHCQEVQVQVQVEAEARAWMHSMAGHAALRDRASALIFSNHDHHHGECSSSRSSSSRTATTTTTETLSRARRSEAYDRAKLELLEEKTLNHSTSSKRCSVASKQRLLAEAEVVLQEALTSALQQQQPEARLEQAKSYVMLGHFYLLQCAWTKSIEAFEQAQARYAERKEHHQSLLTLTFLRQHLTRLYAATGQWAKARASCKVVTTDLRRVILDLDTSTPVWRSQRIWHLTREALKTYDLWLTLMITTAKEEEEDSSSDLDLEEERRNIREQCVALARVGYGQGSLEYAAEVRSIGQQLMHNEKTADEARTYVEIARDLYELHRGPRGSRVSEMNEWLKKIEERKKGGSFTT